MHSILKGSLVCALGLLASEASAESIYNPLKSAVQIMNNKNFDKQVVKNREKGISIVQFYKSDDANSKKDQGQYEKFALEHKMMFRIGSVECNEFNQICQKEGITEYPAYKVYPPTPIPAFFYSGNAIDAELDTDKLKKSLYKYIGNRVIEITDTNHDTFKSENNTKPKMLLFTDKKSTPIVYRALSTYFDKTLEFGLVKHTEENLVKKYKVDKFPSFYLIKAGQTKPEKYKGEGYTYQDLFEFINIYSETFVFGQTEEKIENAATKPWLSSPIPYLSSDSANDICLKKDGTLCVIYVVKDKSASDAALVSDLQELKEQFTSKIERGITFNFMRLDATAEAAFAGLFKLDADSLPAFVVLNPGKKKRFLVSQKEMSASGISATLDIILGGDARFTRIKEDIPAFTNEHEFFQ